MSDSGDSLDSEESVHDLRAESAWRRKRQSCKELSEQAAVVATSAVLPHLRKLCKQQEPLDANTLASAVAAELAPLLRRQPGAVLSAVMDSLMPLLHATAHGHLAAASFATPCRPPTTSVQWPDLEWPDTEAGPPVASLLGRQRTAEYGWCAPPRQPLGRTPSQSITASSDSGRSQLFQAAQPEEALSRAFVVNFRRLMEMLKVFAIFHELIKSTAIAALTLVVAGSMWQLAYSFLFVAVLLSLFGIHFTHYDSMDISDFKKMAGLLEDDGAVWGEVPLSNPNRLFKALTLSRGGSWRRAVTLTFALLCFVMWAILIADWLGALKHGHKWMEFLDGGFYATLLLVGTAMLFFHITFEWLCWRETLCVMPPPDIDEMDCDATGAEVPRSHGWLGLPSMWFTSAEAYNDLRLWIANSKRLGELAAVPRIFPAEMAIFALDTNGGCQLRNALLHAKLYSEQDAAFLTRRHSTCGQPRSLGCREEPEELCMDLVFYDNQSGEFSQPEVAVC